MKLEKIMPGAKACDPKQSARLAKGRATQMYAKAKISGNAKAAVDAKANSVIGHSFHSHKGT
jgi:hypothetical protein